MIYVWASEYRVFLAKSDSVEEAKEKILSAKQSHEIFEYMEKDNSATSDIDNHDIKERQEALKNDPLVIDEDSALILLHANE